VAPEVEGSNPFTHPIFFIHGVKANHAPVAQPDRVADFESVGRTFESYRARQINGLKTIISVKMGP
jgi:hypothetical protein